MAENEILDLGHKRHWARTRRALAAEGCKAAEVIEAAREDIERVCRALPIALRKGEPLRALLGPALNSPLQTQAVIAQFQEKRLATVVCDARKLAASSDPAQIASVAANRMIEGLVSQLEIRVGRSAAFRPQAERQELVANARKAFASYETGLRQIIEASLRGGRIHGFRSPMPRAPRMTLSQLMSLSVADEGANRRAP